MGLSQWSNFVQSVESQPTIGRNMSPPSSRLKNTSSKKKTLKVSEVSSFSRNSTLSRTICSVFCLLHNGFLIDLLLNLVAAIMSFRNVDFPSTDCTSRCIGIDVRHICITIYNHRVTIYNPTGIKVVEFEWLQLNWHMCEVVLEPDFSRVYGYMTASVV